MDLPLVGIILKNLPKLTDIIIEEPILIPEPKEIYGLESSNAYVISSEMQLCVLNISDGDKVINDLKDFLTRYTNIEIGTIAPTEGDLKYLESKDKWNLLDVNNQDGYNLEIYNGRILIYGLYKKGIFYGIQTLIQLLKNALLSTSPSIKKDKLVLPEVEIRDVPDLKIRGIAQDISRGQVFTIENAKRYMDILSHYKLNAYYLYMEDMFSHPKYPLIGKNRGALTQKEIKELDEYAKDKFIDLVPIFETFPHVDNILSLKEYQHLGEFPGAQCFDGCNPEFFSMMEDYISTISKAFSSEYFHIGCDESFDFGKVKTKGLVDQKGKANALVDIYEKLYGFAKKNGKKQIIMYDDIVRINKGIQENLNKDIILMYWVYAPKKKYPSLKKFLDAGFRVIVSPSMLSWQRNFPDTIHSAINMINFIKAAYDNRNNGCLGAVTCTWGDQRYYSFRENEIFGAVMSAALSWNTLVFDFDLFIRMYGFLFYGIEVEKVNDFYDLFKLLSSSADNYYFKIAFMKLVLIPPPYFTHVFKHPFTREKSLPAFSGYRKLGIIGEKSLELYNKIKPLVLFERQNFEYLEYGAELAKITKDKIELSLKTSKVLRNPEHTDEETSELINALESMKEQFLTLKEKFEKLWLRAAKRPCLDVILKRFDYLIKAYDEKISQMKKNVNFLDPYLPSEWIWATEKTCPKEPRYLRHIFELPGPVKKAVLQGIACNYMKVYVNGQEIGDVSSRLSLSILPIINRVRTWDITKLLNPGKNIIALEAYNFEGFKGAINIYGQIALQNSSDIITIISDKSWLTKKSETYDNENWKLLEFDTSTWKPAKSYGRPPTFNGDIYTPDLLNGEKSDTQDYFGMEGYLYNLASMFLGSFGANLIKPLIPKIVKALKPYGK